MPWGFMMAKPKFHFLLLAIGMVLCSGIPSFAQQQTSTVKRQLISEFRKLTGGDVVNRSINFSSESVQKLLSAMFEEDKEITETQKVELQKSVREATARIDKVVRDFLNDTAQITELEEQVIYPIYDKAFTESELKELISFYRTPTAQKSLVFFRNLSPQVQKDFGQVIQVKLSDILQPKIQIEREQLNQKIKAMKSKVGAN
jgi:hypothetical protein